MFDVNTPLRAVVVGAGGMGRAWMDAIGAYDAVRLVGVVDVDPARGAEARAHVGEPELAVAGDLATLADTTPIDFVVDVTVPEAHHAVTMQAFELGLPVLGEKPLAATLTEALELTAASEVYDRLFMVSQSRRYNEHLFAFTDHVRRLGRLGILAAEFFKAPRFGGFRDAMAHPLLIDMAIHIFDAARFVCDAEPVAVYCEEFNPPWSWYAGDAAAMATFEMTGDARFVFTGSWCSDGLETSWDSSWRASAEYGTARWDGNGTPVAEPTQTPDHSGGETVGRPAAAGIAGSLRDFVAALRAGGPPMGECHDNVLSLAMVHAAVESARERRRVLVADVCERAHTEALGRTSGPIREALAAWTTLTPPGTGSGRRS